MTEDLAAHGLSAGRVGIQGWFDFEPPVKLADDVVLRNASVGPYTYVERFSQILNAKVGAYCSIAESVRIGLSRHDPDAVTTHPFPNVNLFRFHEPRHRPTPWFDPDLACVRVEDDVWIGAGSIVVGHRPVTIGRGAIIGAGAVVTRDVLPYTIVAGNPIRTIRQRFPSAVATALLRTRWWTFDLPRFAADSQGDPPPMRQPEDFLHWWNSLSEEDLHPYRLSGRSSRLSRSENGWQVGPAPAAPKRSAET